MDDTCLIACHTGEAAPIIDIVFVHGLKGDARATWQGQGDDGVANFWPDWVAADLPGVRVWSAGYPTTLTNWFDVTLPITALANNLAHRLVNQGVGGAPIVWVGHSMGGLIIKHILTDAANSCVADRKPLWLDTQAVMFMGTPHSGADAASLKVYLNHFVGSAIAAGAVAASALVSGPSGWLAVWAAKLGLSRWLGARHSPPPNVDEMQLHAPALMALNKAFQQLVTMRHKDEPTPRIVAYRETQPLLGVMVVEPHSADPQIAEAEVVDLPHNHLTLCKLASRAAAPHGWLMRQLRRNRGELPSRMALPTGRIFVAYMRDADGKTDPAVLDLVRWLKAQGVQVEVDFNYTYRAPADGWSGWIERSVDQAETVLVIGHAAYAAAFDSGTAAKDDGSFGRGLITRKVYERAGNSPGKFIPVLKDGDPRSHLPTALDDWWCSGLRFPSGHQAILNALCTPPATLAAAPTYPLPTEASL